VPSDRPDRHWSPFVVATYALIVLLLGSNVTTPFYPLYARIFGLSPLGITLLFATYTLLVVPALLLLGPLSDARGRREVLIPAIVLAIVAAVFFAIANAIVWLFAAQAVQAFALGALQGTAAPTLVENDPDGDIRRASAIASAGTTGGAALGPLLAGFLVQYAPLQRRLSFIVEIALLLIALVLVRARLPRREHRSSWRPRRPSVPAPIRRAFAIASVSAFVAWAVTGLFVALIPSFMADVLHNHDFAVAGCVVALMLGSSAVVQIAVRRLPSLAAQIAGLVAMLAGVVFLFVATVTSSLAPLLIATVLSGAGQGGAFMGALGDVNTIAPPDRKGDVVATFYVVIYLATALPVIGVGVLANSMGLLDAVRIFTIVIAAICLAGLVALTAEARRSGRVELVASAAS
jgi:MFS family permease